MYQYNSDITYVKGVGPVKAEILLKEFGIKTIEQFIYHIPHRYVDKTIITPINQLKAEEYYLIEGSIQQIDWSGSKYKKRLSVLFGSPSGYITLNWFKSVNYWEKELKVGQSFLVYGKISEFKGHLSINHPEMHIKQEGKTLKLGYSPIYPLTEMARRRKVDSSFFQKINTEIFNGGLYIPDYLREKEIKDENLLRIDKALKAIHLPTSEREAENGLKRLKFDEIFFLELKHLKQKKNQKKNKGYKIESVGSLFHQFYPTQLSFELTNAQKSVLREIFNDLKTGQQMNRLVQGDVGSGKTMVAFLSLLMMIGNGYQTCYMAPTEILATQHYLGFSEMCSTINISVELITGSTKNSEKQRIKEQLSKGEIDILIGTHALIEKDVIFNKLGLAIIDEQHRFGVRQRAKLWGKYKIKPHVLIMTATPIPRTLGLLFHGHLDVSIIDELPGGRKTIETAHRYLRHKQKIYQFIQAEIKKGRQAYVVFPLIENSEALDYQNLLDGYDDIQKAFPRPEFQFDMLHGKMKAEDKKTVMHRFKEGKSNILVSTTVIEVGVDVPNASIIVIMSAERFGLSQLHQLRGRVGRGKHQSYCILMTKDNLSEEARERMKIMVSTADGFKLSEQDMKLRGMGDLYGTQQSGKIELKYFDPFNPSDLILKERARFLVSQKLQIDPNLNKEENAYLKKLILTHKDYFNWADYS